MSFAASLRCFITVVAVALALAACAGTHPPQARAPAGAARAPGAEHGTQSPEAGGPAAGLQVFGPFTPALFTGDLRALPRLAPWRPGDPVRFKPARDNPSGVVPAVIAPANPVPFTHDPLLEAQAAWRGGTLAFGTPLVNINGQAFSGAIPPDPTGAAGSDYYIQMINANGGSAFVIYSKTSGAVVAGPTLLRTLGTGSCANGLGDPIAAYDELAERWVLSELAASGNRICVYVSRVSGNPLTGGWYAYQVSAPGFPDYPKLGVGGNAYLLSSNESTPAVYAMDRGSMLAGLPATVQRFTAPRLAGFGFQALTPADHDGDLEAPERAPGYFMRHRDDEVHNPTTNDPTRDFVEIWELRADFVTPANSTFTGPTNVAVAEFDSSLCGFTSFSCIQQPGGADLDPLREVIMYRLGYRNFGDYEALLGNFSVDVAFNDRAGVRWFELRKAGGAWALHQQGTWSPDTHSRWMGGIAMDQQGNIALGYSLSSTSEFPDVRYTGRLAGDPPGLMTQGETTAANGAGSSPFNRWGDYSTMTVDPADDCTFWHTNEYALANGNWATRITSFVFDSCLVPPPACGDGALGGDETCDDGNALDGDGCSVLCQVEDGFACTPPVPAGVPRNVVADGSFEGGSPNETWSATATPAAALVCDESCQQPPSNEAYDGLWWARFGGSATPQQASIEQAITIPAGADALGFKLHIPACAGAADFLSVRIDGSEIYLVQPCLVTPGYFQQLIGIQAFADGGTHTLRFESATGSAGVTTLLVDDVQIIDSDPPGAPSVCEALCASFEFGDAAGDLAGWTRFHTGALALDWGTTDDAACWSGALGPPPAANVTGGAGQAACIDSDAAGSGAVVSYLCSPLVDLRAAIDPRLRFAYNYQLRGPAGADDGLTVLAGSAPPGPDTIGGYSSVFATANNRGAFAAGPGAAATVPLGNAEAHLCYRYGANADWYAQLDEIRIVAEACTGGAPDGDGDGVADDADNCLNDVNADQRDTDGDGIGNVCDADFDQSCNVNFGDLGIMKAGFFQPGTTDTDMDGDGQTNFTDLGQLKSRFFLPPGPSGLPNLCGP
jgi:cysteine-rich repeat protein